MSATTSRAASGVQYRLENCGYTADVASVGASLRSLRIEGRDLIVPFAANEVRPAFRGAVLAPWPNRVVDGRYTFDSESRSLRITEPNRGHALHGLAAWLDFDLVAQSAHTVELTAVIEPQAGYPHRVQITALYSLGAEGLVTRISASNIGPSTATVGLSAHPYLVAGPGTVDDWFLSVPADRVMAVPRRLAPTGGVDVDGDLDLRYGQSLSDVSVDHAYTSLALDHCGLTQVVLTDASGVGVVMEWGPNCAWVQIHTADLPDPETTRRGVAVEPMSCPPDAFNSGTDLWRLAPGEGASLWWIIRALRGASGH